MTHDIPESKHKTTLTMVAVTAAASRFINKFPHRVEGDGNNIVVACGWAGLNSLDSGSSLEEV